MYRNLIALALAIAIGQSLIPTAAPLQAQKEEPVYQYSLGSEGEVCGGTCKTWCCTLEPAPPPPVKPVA
jgi:hypothetical protein